MERVNSTCKLTDTLFHINAHIKAEKKTNVDDIFLKKLIFACI
jgi:hypothetical protein